MTTSPPEAQLAEGNINGSDRTLVEPLSPPDMPQSDHDPLATDSTVVAPTLSQHRERDSRGCSLGLGTEQTRIKARRL